MSQVPDLGSPCAAPEAPITLSPTRQRACLEAAWEIEALALLLPRLDLPDQEIRVSNKNSADFECFRFDDLNFFYGMSERERLQRRV